MVIIMTLNFVINLLVVIQIGKRTVGLVIEKYWLRIKQKFNKIKEE